MRSGWNRTTGRLRTGRIAIVFLIGPLAAGWFAPTAAEARPSRIRPLIEAESRAVGRAGSLVNAGHRADGFRILDSLLASASACGDTALRYRVSAAAAGLHAWLDEAPLADSILRPILGRIEACGDTAFFLGAAMWYAKALLDQTHFAEAESVYRRLLPVAVRAGNTESEGWTRMGLAYIALSFGRDHEARDGYEVAERLLRGSGNRFGELEALIGLARAYRQIGETDSSRACCVEACTRARRYGLPRNEAIALNNLGVEEFARGDPAAGLRDFRAAWRIGKSVGDRRETKMPAANAARALAALGRYDEAASVLDSLSVSCHAEGFLDYEAVTLLELGRLWNEAGRPLRALRTYRRVMDLGDELPVGSRLAAYGGSADALARIEGPVKALEILESESCRRLRPVVPADVRVEYDTKRAQLLAEVGRDGEALALAEAGELEADRLHRTELQIALLTMAARVRLTHGDHRTALRHLTRATEAWERLRRRPSDPEWRELWTDGMQLTSTLIQALLADPAQPSDRARLQAAFGAAQRFKARGLAERIEGKTAQAAVIRSISLDGVQRDLLRPGELLLDAFVGPDSSFIFAVTRDRCGLIRLPGEEVLSERISILNELLASPQPGDAEERRATLREVAESLSDSLLGGIRDLVTRSDRILLAPDGPLHLLPLDVLRPAEDGSGKREWLGATRVVVRIPSIAYLARLRAAEVVAGGFESAIVVCGGTNAAGQELVGAQAEARALQRRYRNFRARRTEIDSAAAASADWLAGYRIVHFAAHVELSESYPWRSGILMRSADAPGGTRLLRAERIAAILLDARLVFISGCESARGRVIRGEGIQGLSTAFLAAGARSVVATLWPIEDRATSRFVSFFYGELENGRSAGEALRGAKLRMAREAPYADLSCWAGFVLIGEPETRVQLRPRGSNAVAYRIAGLALLSIALGALVLPRGGILSRRRGA
jgi:CHAT domain-containing protein